MEAATPLHRHSVRVLDQALIIEHLAVEDACVVRLAGTCESAGESLDGFVRNALEIGARVIDREQTGADLEVIREQLQSTTTAVTGALETEATRVTADLTAQVEQLFGAENGMVSQILHRHFADESSTAVQHRVKKAMEEVMQAQREALTKQFNAADDSNPLAQFQKSATEAIGAAARQQGDALRAMTEKISALEVELTRVRGEQEKAEEVAAEAEKGTAKGRTYEESVAEAIELLAVPQGDDALAVGDAAEGRAKTGDVVVTIGLADGPGRGRIVFEAKNRKLSRPDALKELDAAMATRSADFGVLVVPSEDKVPARMLPLREYNGDKLIVTYDPEDGNALPLHVAYALARARVLMSRSDAGDVDVEAVVTAVERAVQTLDEVRRIKSTLTASKTSIDKAAEIVTTMSEGVKVQLVEIAELVRPVETDETQPATVAIEGDPADDGLF